MTKTSARPIRISHSKALEASPRVTSMKSSSRIIFPATSPKIAAPMYVSQRKRLMRTAISAGPRDDDGDAEPEAEEHEEQASPGDSGNRQYVIRGYDEVRDNNDADRLG